jgi:hypothetical protein
VKWFMRNGRTLVGTSAHHRAAPTAALALWVQVAEAAISGSVNYGAMTARALAAFTAAVNAARSYSP